MRVVVADDAALVREGVAAILERAGFTVVARAADAEELLAAVERERPDLAVVDVRMPPTGTDEGIVAARALRRDHPGTGVLILSQHVEVERALDLLADERGGVGYLLKQRVGHVDEFVDAANRVARGGTALDPVLVGEIVGRRVQHDPLAALTPGERRVLELMAEGLSNRGVARHLVVTESAVEKHVRAIYAKLGLSAEPDDHRRVKAVLAWLEAR